MRCAAKTKPRESRASSLIRQQTDDNDNVERDGTLLRGDGASLSRELYALVTSNFKLLGKQPSNSTDLHTFPLRNSLSLLARFCTGAFELTPFLVWQRGKR